MGIGSNKLGKRKGQNISYKHHIARIKTIVESLKHYTWSTYLITRHNSGHLQWHQQDLRSRKSIKITEVMVRLCQFSHQKELKLYFDTS